MIEPTSIKWFVCENKLIYIHKYIKEYIYVRLYVPIVEFLFSIINNVLNLGIYSTRDFFSNSVIRSRNQLFFSKIKENNHFFFLLVYNKIYFSITNKMNSRIDFIDFYVFNLKM